MRLATILLIGQAFCAGMLGPAAAQQSRPGAGQPGAIIQGSQDTTVGGRPAARAGDATTTGAPLVEGSPNVFINGRPAAIVGGRTGCGGVTVGGASNVLINGKPAAQTGSQTTDCVK
jgi:uncharacterized Zn-binding protein involved in type VI secretion